MKNMEIIAYSEFVTRKFRADIKDLTSRLNYMWFSMAVIIFWGVPFLLKRSFELMGELISWKGAQMAVVFSVLIGININGREIGLGTTEGILLLLQSFGMTGVKAFQGYRKFRTSKFREDISKEER